MKIRRVTSLSITGLVALGVGLFFASDQFRTFVTEKAMDGMEYLTTQISIMTEKSSQGIADRWTDDLNEQLEKTKTKT